MKKKMNFILFWLFKIVLIYSRNFLKNNIIIVNSITILYQILEKLKII